MYQVIMDGEKGCEFINVFAKFWIFVSILQIVH